MFFSRAAKLPRVDLAVRVWGRVATVFAGVAGVTPALAHACTSKSILQADVATVTDALVVTLVEPSWRVPGHTSDSPEAGPVN